jgi:hypothetical protein
MVYLLRWFLAHWKINIAANIKLTLTIENYSNILKMFTLYIGSIDSQFISDDSIHKILKICGCLSKWRRVIDASGNQKPFGFAEFSSIEGLDRTLRLLPKVLTEMNSCNALTLKVDSKIEVELERYRVNPGTEAMDQQICHDIQNILQPIAETESSKTSLPMLIQKIQQAEHKRQEEERSNSMEAYKKRLEILERREDDRARLVEKFIDNITKKTVTNDMFDLMDHERDQDMRLVGIYSSKKEQFSIKPI